MVITQTNVETPCLRATAALTKRWIWRLKRQPAGVATALIQPVLSLILFEEVTVVPGYSYIAFMTAGLVVMTVFNGCSTRVWKYYLIRNPGCYSG